MGKAYDGKKRWNETILATTVRASASGGRTMATKKRLSVRTHKLSAAMKRVDESTRNEVQNARLDALEADNFGEDVDDGDGGLDGDEAYVEEHGGEAIVALGGREPLRKKRKSVVLGKKTWKVKSLAQVVFEEVGACENVIGPNYVTIAAGPPIHPARKFCCGCGYFATYNCQRCGSKYCSVRCGDQHKESGCLKFGL